MKHPGAITRLFFLAPLVWVLTGMGSAAGFTADDRAALAGSGEVVETDVCVYGGTSAGVVAAIQARRMGKRAIIVEFGKHLGGMTSGGLSLTDIGNPKALGGMAREFYARVREYYRSTYGGASPQCRASYNGFRFEPRVAEKIFNDMVAEAGVPIYLDQRLHSAQKQGSRITQITMESGRIFRAKMFIDATYEGDLMARARVSYTVGREANTQYGETLNGIHFGHPNHNFRAAVDPYVMPGNPSSGLLKGISSQDAGKHGEGDRRVQAYNFRMCLTNIPWKRLPFPRPKDYDPDRYTLLARYIQAGIWDAVELINRIPNGKIDSNNMGAFSTDNIGMNYDWPEGDYATRERIFQDHMTYQQGLMWFLSNDERVPPAMRIQVGLWGLPKDEFTDNEGWPHQLYIREARRMLSAYVMTEHNCMSRQGSKVNDSIGLGAYRMDSHNCQRVVVNGRVMNEGNVEIGIPAPYPIAYRSIVPKEPECENLLVPVCVSASHIAYGSIRMEPTFMILGQSAAAAASLAIDGNISVQQVSVGELQVKLRQYGQILECGGVRSTAPSGGDTDTTIGETMVPAPGDTPGGTLPTKEPGECQLIDRTTLKGIVLDDTEGKKIGEWVTSTRPEERRIGEGCLTDGNANKGAYFITYTPDIPEEGTYAVVLIFAPNPSAATNVPVTINVEGVGRSTVKVNQRITDQNGLVSLGVYKLPKGKRTSVTISNKETDGIVLVDAVQFAPV
jgi:FAD-dependent oxidoreductase family protein